MQELCDESGRHQNSLEFRMNLIQSETSTFHRRLTYVRHFFHFLNNFLSLNAIVPSWLPNKVA